MGRLAEISLRSLRRTLLERSRRSQEQVIGFRPKKRTKSIYRLPLNPGDVYLMSGAARWHWEHRVMPVEMQGSDGSSFSMSYKG